MAYTRTMNGKVPQVLQELHFDETPTPGSLNPVTSGGVAGSVAKQSSNIAPEYTKTTYPANSYVIYGGVLYTNPNAIGTAEDWNPAHWTQTTVAEMMAGASTKWTRRTETVNVPGSKLTQINIQDHEIVTLSTTHGDSNIDGTLALHLHGECYVHLNKDFRTKVLPLFGNDMPTSIINSGIVSLNQDNLAALSCTSSGMSATYDPDDYEFIQVLGAETSIQIDQPDPMNSSEQHLLLHSLGEGTIIITPLPLQTGLFR